MFDCFILDYQLLSGFIVCFTQKTVSLVYKEPLWRDTNAGRSLYNVLFVINQNQKVSTNFRKNSK